MTFGEYLKTKKIDEEAFKYAEAERWSSFRELFDQIHPNSFTAQKLFLINKVRRSYPLKRQPSVTETNAPENRPPGNPKPAVKWAKPMMKKPKLK